MKARGRTDTELASILEHVHLAYLPSREGGWETRKEWKDVLSGGEKQRVSLIVLFNGMSLYIRWEWLDYCKLKETCTEADDQLPPTILCCS